MADSFLYDFFISYKRKDTADFVNELKVQLEHNKYDVWLDTLEILPGDSILSGIERGISSSLAIVLVFSPNYFEGWSEHERRAAFNLANSKKVHLIPLWYDVDNNFIQKTAPLFADINAIIFKSSENKSVKNVSDKLAISVRPADKEQKLFEFYFKCLVEKFPDDPDLNLWVALFDNDIDRLKEALENGADPNGTNTQLYNKYAKLSIDCGCFVEWRKLFLFFHEQDKLKSRRGE